MQNKKTSRLKNIVEITGPTGVGKSTIMNELQKIRKEDDSWIYAPDLIKKYRGPGLNPRTWKMAAGRRFHKENPEFWKEFHSHHKTFIEKDSWYIKRKRAFEFYQMYAEFQAVHELYQKDKVPKWPVCVIEESMIYRSFTRLEMDINSSSLIKFAESFPLPGNLICLDAPADVIAGRAYSRKKTPPIHRGLNKDEIEDAARIHKNRFDKLLLFLDHLGVKTHRVSVVGAPVDSAQKIHELLKKIADDIS